MRLRSLFYVFNYEMPLQFTGAFIPSNVQTPTHTHTHTPSICCYIIETKTQWKRGLCWNGRKPPKLLSFAEWNKVRERLNDCKSFHSLALLNSHFLFSLHDGWQVSWNEKRNMRLCYCCFVLIRSSLWSKMSGVRNNSMIFMARRSNL